MKAQIKRAALLFAGWTFIVTGVIGLFLPLMQGMLFIFIGLLILSSEYVWAHNLLKKLRAKFPRISNLLDRAENRARSWFRGNGAAAEPVVTRRAAAAEADD